MRRLLFFVLACAACDGESGGGPDTDASVDAAVDAITQGPDSGGGGGGGPACEAVQWVQCSLSTASVSFTFYNPQHPNHPCTRPTTTGAGSVVCAQGCRVEVSQRYYYLPYIALVEPADLCAETPDAQIGDACGNAVNKCLPSSAQLNGDGTVAGRQQLACNASNQCEAGAAPVWPDYLDACGPTVVATAVAGTYGAIAYDPMIAGRTCLVAWNAATSTMHSGETRQCLGDWQCPENAICDAVPYLSGTGSSGQTTAVCKPGPRGTLTPAMLPN